MIYTNGIKKIFQASVFNAGKHISEAQEVAQNAGYYLLNFNSEIWVCDKHTKKWILSPLKISDFEINF